MNDNPLIMPLNYDRRVADRRKNRRRLAALQKQERAVYAILWLLAGVALGMAVTGSLAFL